MPVQHDQNQLISQGCLHCRSPGDSDFVKCFVVLDRPKQILICYTKCSSPSNQDHMSVHHDNWPVYTKLSTDSISLVEEASKIQKQFCFAIHSLAKITYLAAESWKDMVEWMDCIKDASRISVNKSCLKPDRQSWTGSYVATVVGGSVVHTPVSSNVQDTGVESFPPERRGSGQTRPHVVRSGYCVKQGAKMKNWKRRYLILTEEELTYTKNEFVDKPLKRIAVSDIKDVRVSQSELTSVRSNLIDIQTPERTFYMQFDSMDEMYSWLEDIRKLVFTTIGAVAICLKSH
ncbi:pleckstrin homology domain-containing family A member 2-like isoform X2 [Watersipora subatra]|uniref:pleckstrin homology domain-containing family A member 2-like isoform X2 n=1 Tax=Watersipora subatra TaxID=2589382 RepID=UPI00355C2217